MCLLLLVLSVKSRLSPESEIECTVVRSIAIVERDWTVPWIPYIAGPHISMCPTTLVRTFMRSLATEPYRRATASFSLVKMLRSDVNKYLNAVHREVVEHKHTESTSK